MVNGESVTGYSLKCSERFLMLLCMALVAAPLGGCKYPSDEGVELPRLWNVGPLVCDDDRLLVFAENTVYGEGHGARVFRPPTSETYFLELEANARRARTIWQRPERVTDAAQIDELTLMLRTVETRLESDMTQEEIREAVPSLGYRDIYIAAKLMRSFDEGRTLEPFEVPTRHPIGFDFSSLNQGWVWSSDTVFQTSDGGMSWQEVAVRPRLTSYGVSDASGNLYVVADHGSESEYRDAVIRVSLARDVEVLIDDAGAHVLGIAMTPESDVMLVTGVSGESVLEIEVLDPSSGVRRTVSTMDGDVADPFIIRGGIAAMIRTISGDVANLHDAMYSEDVGHTWKNVGPWMSNAEAICVTESGGLWLIDGTNRIYSPR